MTFQSPRFWWQAPGFSAYSLLPIATLFGAVAARRMKNVHCPKVNVPVLCIGNYTLGGAGKTPLAIEIAKGAVRQNLTPGFVSRGYRKQSSGISLVDLRRDRVRDVGDEPLLLAKYGQVAVGVDRYQAAIKLRDMGVDFIIMDDGFQSRRLYPDYSLLVIDAMRGLGNAMVFPAGPLRAPLPVQLDLTDGILILGENDATTALSKAYKARLATLTQKPIAFSTGRLQPFSKDSIAGKRFLAFAGVGNPQKFYASVTKMGGSVVEHQDFPDHHFFTTVELLSLEKRANASGLDLVTTAKDFIRLRTDSALPSNIVSEISQKLAVVDVKVAPTQRCFIENLVADVVEKFNARLHSALVKGL